MACETDRGGLKSRRDQDGFLGMTIDNISNSLRLRNSKRIAQMRSRPMMLMKKLVLLLSFVLIPHSMFKQEFDISSPS
jgi:hypothetical protein